LSIKPMIRGFKLSHIKLIKSGVIFVHLYKAYKKRL
jgi:hypothetical protein